MSTDVVVVLYYYIIFYYRLMIFAQKTDFPSMSVNIDWLFSVRKFGCGGEGGECPRRCVELLEII